MRLNGVLPSCVAFRPSGVLGGLLLCVLVALTGCSSKNITSKGPFVLQEPSKGYPSVPSSSGQKTGTVYLPSDDGRPLTKAEQEAFLSEGEIDRNLPQEELGDVLLHFKYLVHKDRYTVEKNLERAQLYMPFIYETLRSRGLPRELAYVAFIESGYNPMATSSSGAAGMWQFISSTGKHYGMEQDWWMDERRDPYQSTRAAADYLDKLYKMFNDWHLAVTAYNAGEGKIQRGLAATGAKTFFELRRKNEQIYSVRDRLSDENKQYLPKFLAVCKFVADCGSQGQTGDGPHAVLQEHRHELGGVFGAQPGVSALCEPPLALYQDLCAPRDGWQGAGPAFQAASGKQRQELCRAAGL